MEVGGDNSLRQSIWSFVRSLCILRFTEFLLNSNGFFPVLWNARALSSLLFQADFLCRVSSMGFSLLRATFFWGTGDDFSYLLATWKVRWWWLVASYLAWSEARTLGIPHFPCPDDTLGGAALRCCAGLVSQLGGREATPAFSMTPSTRWCRQPFRYAGDYFLLGSWWLTSQNDRWLWRWSVSTNNLGSYYVETSILSKNSRQTRALP